MPLRDYIYVDQKRLDSYVEQIASPFVKVPIWTFSLSLAGPKVKGEQQQISGKRTQAEKIELLLEHLKKHAELAEGRIRSSNYFNYPPVFRIETCSVVDVYVPSLRPRETGPDALTLWVSTDETDQSSRLFLLQDFKGSDSLAFGAHSAYSSLLLIYQQVISRSQKYQESFVSELRNRELERLQRNPPSFGSTIKLNPLRQPGLNPELLSDSNPEGMFQEVDRRVERQLAQYFPLRNPLDKEIQKRFAVEPLSVLSDMGAQIGSQKNIETLYRVRDVHMETLPSEERTAIITFGYPIFVSAV